MEAEEGRPRQGREAVQTPQVRRKGSAVLNATDRSSRGRPGIEEGAREGGGR